MALSPWADPMVFAKGERGELSVPLSELQQLWSDDQGDDVATLQSCIERFGDWAQLVPNAHVGAATLHSKKL